MNAVARTTNIYVQPLLNEVVVYDRTDHKAHCLNKTVFKVWQNANGTRSVDQLAELLNQDIDNTCSREVVLLALEDLRRANLLQAGTEPAAARLPSRREIARKLSMAGLSVSLLPFVASMVAPTPAMARSGGYTAANYQQECNQAELEASKEELELLENYNGSLTDLDTAIQDGANGILATAQGNQAAAQTDFINAETELNAMLKALGLPALPPL